MSFIAWLDTSSEQQKRMREIVKLFEDTSTLDELGIGQIRDAFSNLLFPGTSVLLTRARYYLFVPWAFQLAAERRRSNPSAILPTAENYERTLIEAVRKSGDTLGLIGSQAGVKIRTLPSQIYWNGLLTYGILTSNISRQQISRPPDHREDVDELAERHLGHWSPTLPERPAGFPNEMADGFALSADEAGWLRDRMLTSVPDSLLARLVRTPGDQLDVTLDGPVGPWDACRTLDLDEDLRRQLEHAELFSLSIQGAALLYNLLVAEKFEAAGFSNPQALVAPAEYRDWFDDWTEEVEAQRHRFAAWDIDDFWRMVGQATTVQWQTRLFVDTWLSAVRSGRAATAPGDAELRSLVAEREVRKKGRLARLQNNDQLRRWAGQSGTARLVHRWGNIRRILGDIEEGLLRVGS